MKSRFLYLCLLLFGIIVIGCVQNEDPFIEPKASDLSFGQTQNVRSVHDAIAIVNNLLSEGAVPNSRSSRQVSQQDVHVVISNASRSSVDTLIYAVDLGDDNGFVLVSAPIGVEPILAVTESGSFGEKETLENQPFQNALRMAKEYVVLARDGNIIIPDPAPEDTTGYVIMKEYYYDTVKVEDEYVPNMLDTKWGQKWPMNQYCPNKIVGCVPLGVAEVLSAFDRVSYYEYTFTEKDIDSEYVNWGELKKHKEGLRDSLPNLVLKKLHAHSCPLKGDGHNTLARAVRHIGQQIDALYFEDRTSAYHYWGLGYLKRELSNVTTITDEGGTSLFNNIKKTPGIAFVSGVDYVNFDTGAGHTWVIDGAWERTFHLKKYVVDSSALGTYKYDSSLTTKKQYLHNNWGWDGIANGYFLKDIFSTHKGFVYDDENDELPKYYLSGDFEYCLFVK